MRCLFVPRQPAFRANVVNIRGFSALSIEIEIAIEIDFLFYFF